MQDIINKIIKKNKDFFKGVRLINKIDSGFINDVYNIDDKYIVKVCIKESNEEKFLNEIKFYNEHKNYDFIPRFYLSDTTKKIVPYFYEIIQKVEGNTLYTIWHELTDEKKEEIIVKLCNIMRILHEDVGNKYDFKSYLKDKFNFYYERVRDIFSVSEQKIIEYAGTILDKIFKEEDIVFIHNDLHFDNIIYNSGDLKIIDFERGMYAPRDMELLIPFMMIDNPNKFCNANDEKNVDRNDYSSIKSYIYKYYPKIVKNIYLNERIAAYSLVYFLNQFNTYPNSNNLKKSIMNAVKIITLRRNWPFNKVRTLREIYDFMVINVDYGWLDIDDKKHYFEQVNFSKKYKIGSIDEMLGAGIGTNFEQNKLIKYFLDNLKIKNKLYAVRIFKEEKSVPEIFCFNLCFYQDNWCYIETSDIKTRGIYKYALEKSAIKDILSKYEGKILLTQIPKIPHGLSYIEFNEYIDSYEEMPLEDILN